MNDCSTQSVPFDSSVYRATWESYSDALGCGHGASVPPRHTRPGQSTTTEGALIEPVPGYAYRLGEMLTMEAFASPKEGLAAVLAMLDCAIANATSTPTITARAMRSYNAEQLRQITFESCTEENATQVINEEARCLQDGADRVAIADELSSCEIKDTKAVQGFLEKHPNVARCLPDGIRCARRVFGAGTPIRLRVSQDREASDISVLFADILSPLELSEAQALLDELDDMWYLLLPEEIASLFNFGLIIT